MKHEEKIIVLRKIKHGESNLIVHGLNKHGAKMSFFARAAAKSLKRFGGGVLEPTHYIRINYHESKSEDGLMQLEEAKLLEDFRHLRSNYERLDTALYAVTLIEKVSKEGVVDSPEIFDLLGNTLRAAETSEDLPKLRLHFQIRLLATQGVLPSTLGIDMFLSKPIREHQSVEVSTEDFSSLTIHIQKLLDQYLD